MIGSIIVSGFEWGNYMIFNNFSQDGNYHEVVESRILNEPNPYIYIGSIHRYYVDSVNKVFEFQ